MSVVKVANDLLDRIPEAGKWLNTNGELVTSDEHLEYLVSIGIDIDQDVIDQVRQEGIAEPEPVAAGELDPKYCVPKYDKIVPTTISSDSKAKVRIIGSYLSPGLVFTAGDYDVRIESWSEHELTIEIDLLGVDFNGNLQLKANGNTISTLTVANIRWIDLKDIDSSTLVNFGNVNPIILDDDGLGDDNGTGWQKAIAVPSLALDRSQETGFQMVYKIQRTGSAMFGMFASGHGVDTSMYNEMHVGFFINSQTSFWGYYAGTTRSNSESIADYTRLRVSFPGGANPGDIFKVYGLVDGDSYDDGVLLWESSVPSGQQDPGDTIYPCIIPNNSRGARLVAFKAIGA